MHLRLCGFRASSRIGWWQAGDILAEGMTWNEAVKIVFGVEIITVVVPAAEVRTGSGHALPMPKGLEQAIFIQVQEKFVVVFKLLAEQALEQLHLRILKDRKRRHDRYLNTGKCP